MSKLIIQSGSGTRILKVMAAGPQGPRGPAGSGGDLNYVHTQTVPSTTWTITHGLSKYPSATIISSANDEVIGDVSYPSTSQVIINFTAAFSGRCTLN